MTLNSSSVFSARNTVPLPFDLIAISFSDVQ